MSDIEKIQQAMTIKGNEEMRKNLNRSYDSLIIQRTTVNLPEHVFRGYFLPYFSGNTNLPMYQGKDIIAEWIGIAGSPMGEVNVILPNGQIAFTVPAMFDTNTLSVNGQARGGLKNILQEYEMRKAGVPAAANNFLMNSLYNESKQITSTPIDMNPATERWVKIFKYYGILPKTEVSNMNPGAQLDTDDDLVYE
jgi:hypothetical protein